MELREFRVRAPRASVCCFYVLIVSAVVLLGSGVGSALQVLLRGVQRPVYTFALLPGLAMRSGEAALTSDLLACAAFATAVTIGAFLLKAPKSYAVVYLPTVCIGIVAMDGAFGLSLGGTPIALLAVATVLVLVPSSRRFLRSDRRDEVQLSRTREKSN